MNYYPHNIGDFAIETKYMTFEQKGIYVDLLDRYLSTGKPLATQWVAAIERLASDGAVKSVLTLCFEEKDGFYYHAGCEKLLADYAATVEKNRRNARSRSKRTSETVEDEQFEPSGNPVSAQSLATGVPNQEPITKNQEPRTNNQKPEKEEARSKPARRPAPKLVKPEGVSDGVWDEWQALKRKLCKSCSQRMVDAIDREAQKAGMTVEEAMVYQLEKGWKGFEAEWVLRDRGQFSDQPKSQTKFVLREKRQEDRRYGL